MHCLLGMWCLQALLTETCTSHYLSPFATSAINLNTDKKLN
jgi:hypothetical protein